MCFIVHCVHKYGITCVLICIYVVGVRRIRVFGSHVPANVDYVPPTVFKPSQQTRMLLPESGRIAQIAGLTVAASHIHDHASSHPNSIGRKIIFKG